MTLFKGLLAHKSTLSVKSCTCCPLWRNKSWTFKTRHYKPLLATTQLMSRRWKLNLIINYPPNICFYLAAVTVENKGTLLTLLCKCPLKIVSLGFPTDQYTPIQPHSPHKSNVDTTQPLEMNPITRVRM